jgi:hypothetical protein
MTRIRGPWPLAASLVLAGCGLVPNDPVPAAGPQSLTDCEPPLAFEGDATVADLGLADAVPNIGVADATRPGRIQITRDTVTHEQFAPPGAPVVVPEGQLLCVTWPDGSGFTTMLGEPFAGVAEAPLANAGAPSLLTPILVGVGALLLVGISWMAFRREARPPT